MTAQEIALLYDEYYEPLYRFVYFRIGHQQDTEDLLSAIFEKIIKVFDHYKAQGLTQEHVTAAKWIYTIARNTVIDYYRAHGKHPITDLEDAELIADTTPHLDNVIDLQLSLDQAQRLLAQLSERQREVVLLRYQSEFSNKEIAELLNIDERTVSSLLSKGLANLRSHL